MPRQSKIKKSLRRIAHMSGEEAVFRIRQQAWNRLEAFRSRVRPGSQDDPKWRNAPATSQQAGHFFFSSADLPAILEVIRTRFQSKASDIVDSAERILAHRFDLLGYCDLDLGQQINWHFDPVNRKQAPLKQAYAVPFLDFDKCGDSKIVWELNRHQHFMTLGKAYQLTGDDRFSNEFARQFCDWQKQNPYLVGINWASSLEVAFRSLSWLWARELFAGSPSFTEHLKLDLLLALGRNARFLEHNLSTYFSRNTHLLGEALGLFFIGVMCPELKDASAWRAMGWEIILNESRHQVRSDGGYFEQSTYYHVYALDMLLHARMLAARNLQPIPDILDHTLEKMLDFLAALSMGGPPSRLGDDDGGRLFDPCRNQAEHLSDPLSTGATLFGRADWKSAAPDLAEETLWLLGPSAVAAFDALSAPKEGRLESRAFTESGVYIMSCEGLRLTMDAGPLGTGHCGHGHADALSVTVAADGHECLTDPGTYTYTGSLEWRDIFRGTSAHNTLTVASKDQAEPAAPFKWENIPEVQAEHWWTGENFDFMVASHSGYLKTASRATHRRTVLFLKPKFWLIYDSVRGEGSHELDLYWHLPRGSAAMDGTGIKLSSPEGSSFGIVPAADSGWKLELVDGWTSKCYGHKQKTPVLHCSTKAALPAGTAALLIPRLRGRCGRLERMTNGAGAGAVNGFHYTTDSEQHWWVVADNGEPWQMGSIKSDARLAYLGPDHAFMWEGSFLSFAGEKVVGLPERKSFLEQKLPGGGWSLLNKSHAEAAALLSGRTE